MQSIFTDSGLGSYLKNQIQVTARDSVALVIYMSTFKY